MVKIEKYFPNIKTIFTASRYELELAGLNNKITSAFLAWRKNFPLASTEEYLNKERIFYITKDDNGFPQILKEIHACPYILFYQGNIGLFSEKKYYALAIVGSRRHTAYGEKIISNIIPALVNQKIVIVSGLALGIDTLAHQATLLHSGKTIGVLGSGLDEKNIYPQANRGLIKKIIENNGLIISEFPPRTPPLKGNFPRRNRIISGLCQATLVIEADIKSGSLITANFALEQNREVLAVPGNIYSDYSRGTNELLKVGAKLVTSPNDVLEAFPCEESSPPSITDKTRKHLTLKSRTETIVYDLIMAAHDRGEKITSDEIAERSQLDTSVINSTLSILELEGIAKNDGIGYDIS